MDIVEKLREVLLVRSKNFDANDFILHGQWGLELLFQPNPSERIFKYRVILTQTKKQGCCYCANKQSKIDASLMGRDVRYVKTKNRCLDIALLDAGFSAFNTPPEISHTLDGTSSEKAQLRAEIVVNEVMYQLEDLSTHKTPKIVNIGVVGNILQKLSDKGYRVSATDLDKEIIGQDVHHVKIQDGNIHTLELVSQSDLALITGMVLATQTLEDILSTAAQSKTKIVMFAETGAWFANEFCSSFGIDSVISEPFPFYIFEGRSMINIFRKK